MANVFVENSYLKAIANAIRNKLGVTTKYKPSEMAGAINSIVGQATLGTKTITTNGTYDAEDDSLDGYSEVTVNVPQGITPTGTKQISIIQNGTIIEDVANYANAEITVSVSGGSTWTEYTATSGASNAQACANLLFPSQTSGKHYFAYLIDKDVSNFVNNQFVMLSWYRNGNSMVGGGTRYKSGSYGNLQGISNSYDAVIEIGDKFMVCEM